jgi:hypothetical protein
MTHHSPETISSCAAALRDFILSSVASGKPGSGSEFNQLALRLFALQFAHNAPYRKFCESRQAAPSTVSSWTHIPAVPAAAFKDWDLTIFALADRTRVFHSSGTTEQRPSRHFHNAESLALYETSLRSWFAANFFTSASSARKHDFLFLTPPSTQAPHSSLVHMFETICQNFGSPASAFTGHLDATNIWNLDLAATLDLLHRSVATDQPLIIMGTAFSFVHLLDHLQTIGEDFHLPPGSRALETGGYKGRSRALPKPELHALISQRLGIAQANIICEYGMSELSSQAYDTAKIPGGERAFHFPPWARVQIISPETGREVSEGETGLIRIFDLANAWSVLAIQTEDLAIRRGDGFELIGRAALAEPRGCSLQSI